MSPLELVSHNVIYHKKWRNPGGQVYKEPPPSLAIVLMLVISTTKSTMLFFMTFLTALGKYVVHWHFHSMGVKYEILWFNHSLV